MPISGPMAWRTARTVSETCNGVAIPTVSAIPTRLTPNLETAPYIYIENKVARMHLTILIRYIINESNDLVTELKYMAKITRNTIYYVP